MPEAQTLLIVSEETSIGMPALIWAWREGIWPTPACRTCPITTCCTCSGSMSARSSAAPIAMPPRSVGCRDAKPPPILPTGVRALPRMTVRGMQVSRSEEDIDPRSRHHPGVPPSDAELLDAARGGDEAAFAALIGRHRGELLRHCYRMLGSPQDAEDNVLLRYALRAG